MTTQEIRDELARMDGFTRHEPPGGGDPYWTHESSRDPFYADPHPATRDGAAAAMPEGWTWGRGWNVLRWIATKTGTCWADGVQVPDTGDEIHDRYSLALAARKAQVTR